MKTKPRPQLAILTELTRNDFAVRYLGSYLGIFWAFIHPAVTLTVLWFVFEIGFRSQPVLHVPFFLWLMTGLIPWFYFQEAISGSSTTFLDNQHLVKKMVFNVNLLPFVRACSTFVIHLVFIVILFFCYLIMGVGIPWQAVQLPYYMLAMLTLTVAFALIVSSLTIFARDTPQVVSIVLQIGFWLTPIFWPLQMLPPGVRDWFRLNPFHYVIEGYRNCLIHREWFWEAPMQLLYFWGFTGLLLLAGITIFRRLKPHFGDAI